jgi:phospholipase C
MSLGGTLSDTQVAAQASSPLVTLKASPNPSVAGQPIGLSGTVRGVKGGVTVTLWSRQANQGLFHASLKAKTGPHGGFKFLMRPGAITTNRYWFATARQDRSGTVSESVQAAITVSSSDNIPPPGETVAFSGHIAPSYAGHKFELQENAGNSWQVLARPWLDRNSNFYTTRAMNTQGNIRLRAFMPKTKQNANSYSSVLILSVLPIHKIKHVVVIMQENRSFDSYFGTFAGADGINPASPPCVPDPLHGAPVCAFPDHHDVNSGGPHSQNNATVDMGCANTSTRSGCQMNGFVEEAQRGSNCGTDPNNPQCSPCDSSSAGSCNDVMGYHDGSDIPNYWAYARNFVLQDHMFEPNASWSLPEHLFQVSEWSARCTDPFNAFSCTNALQSPTGSSIGGTGGVNDGQLHYAWTDMTYLLHKNNISWGYYVFRGTEPDCESDAAMTCAPVQQGPQTPGIWNPLPSFTDVYQDGQLGNIQTLSNFYTAARSGSLPAVSWIDPNGTVSEHPPARVSAGQTYVTGLINAIMQSPDWSSTAIFLSWDDWGGFYDHVVPPSVDQNGYGLRVPGLLISPYAKIGYVDSQTLSHDAYNKFIEADFIRGQSLNPATDGRPDPRPDVREANPNLGDLTSEFDFTQAARQPLILPVCPTTALQPAPRC